MSIKWAFCNTSIDQPTIIVSNSEKTFYMHSKYNPLQEAVRWVESLSINENNDSIVLVGMGAGYHAQALHEKYPSVPIYVWDFNVEFKEWIEKSKLLSWMEQCTDSVFYRATESWEEINSIFLPQVKKTGTILLLHPPSLDIIPNKLTDFKKLLDEHLLFIRSFRKQGQKLKENYQNNLLLGDTGIKDWIGRYKGNPMILISAGPSLDKQLKLLVEISKSKSYILGSVGTALKPLLKAGIKPNFIMLSDAQEIILEQINNIDINDLPLFYLCTANAKAVSYYQGPRYIVWQKGFEQGEQQAFNRGEQLIQTGGSVATCLLDLMVQMGGSPIALVGQDLAFTNGQSHTNNAPGKMIIDPKIASIKVPDFYLQSTVSTCRNLYTYLQWFSRYIRDKQVNSRFWNCTEGGAYIDGWIHKPLSEFMNFVN